MKANISRCEPVKNDTIMQIFVQPVYVVSTGNDGYSGDRYSGNDGYSGQNPPDDAILFTVSGITAIADKNGRF